MGKKSNEFWWNLVVDRVVGGRDDVLSDTDIQELLAKKELVLIRSAKENVMYDLLEQLSSNGYAGNLHVIGRHGDEKYISEYSGMNMDLFAIDDSEVYSVENTKAYLDKIQADAVCFLFHLEISSSHNNLLQIMHYITCQGYAVSKDIQVVKFDMAKLHNYFRGMALYDALCDWFYDTK
ncbi:MAG: hypothetical protein HDR09_04675 [Lachnospiraceae bacterium]|nr:hypothetical protein [Lachnospiraceae bacterium]